MGDRPVSNFPRTNTFDKNLSSVKNKGSLNEQFANDLFFIAGRIFIGLKRFADFAPKLLINLEILD
jgi:hypothetical protein